jgi:hypothetical protein
MSEKLKKMMQDARNWEALEKRLKGQLNQPVQIVANSHLKGYIFDSLVFRYMKARDAQIELEIKREGITYEKAKARADRDTVRFIQILNEAIGEHD